MVERWEYQNLVYRRFRQDNAWHFHVALFQGDGWSVIWEGTQTDDLPRSQTLLNEYGLEGWELMGPPLQENAVFYERDDDESGRGISVAGGFSCRSG